MRSKLPLLVTLAAVAAIGLSGCGSSSDAASPASTHTSRTMTSMTPTSPGTSMKPAKTPAMGNMVMIGIKNYAYMGTMTVKAGQMIMVTNNDTETHTLTSDQPGVFDVSVNAAGGTAMFNAPSKPGSYPYHCTFHSNMHGTLIVK